MDREAPCHVYARWEQTNGSPYYSEGVVLKAPADLPDGAYVAMFDGHSLGVTKKLGIWLSTGVIERVLLAFPDATSSYATAITWSSRENAEAAD